MIKVSPSILSADFAQMGKSVKMVDEFGADFIHCDIMDGMFVPNISFGPAMVKAVRQHTKKTLDVHLMIEKPERYIDEFVAAGADYIIIHFESSPNPRKILEYIRAKGVKAGIAYNPETDISSLKYLLENIDMVLLMTVNPGFSGQKFIPEVIPKIEKAQEIIGERSILIGVDGGINEENAPLVKAAGANLLVAGSAIFHSKDIKATIENLKNR